MCLDGSSQLVNGIKRVVIVCTTRITQIISRCQLTCFHKCRLIQGVRIICVHLRICSLRVTATGTARISSYSIGGVIVIVGRRITVIITVKVCDSYTNVHRLSVRAIRLQLSNQVCQRIFQNLETCLGGVIAVFILNVIGIHRGRSIQHDNNVSALLDGHTGGGQLDLSDTGGLEVDTGGGLIDLNCTLVGVLGVVGGSLNGHVDILVGSICVTIRSPGVGNLHLTAAGTVVKGDKAGVGNAVDDGTSVAVDGEAPATACGQGGRSVVPQQVEVNLLGVGAALDQVVHDVGSIHAVGCARNRGVTDQFLGRIISGVYIDLNLNGTKGSIVIEDLHGVGAAERGVVGVNPTEGDVIVGGSAVVDDGLVGVQLVVGHGHGDARHNLGQSISGRGALLYGVKRFALSDVILVSIWNHHFGNAQRFAVIGNGHFIVTGGVCMIGLRKLQCQFVDINVFIHRVGGGLVAHALEGLNGELISQACQCGIRTSTNLHIVGQVAGELVEGAVLCFSGSTADNGSTVSGIQANSTTRGRNTGSGQIVRPVTALITNSICPVSIANRPPRCTRIVASTSSKH